MQSLAALDAIFWIFSIIAFIVYIWERIGKSSRSGRRDDDVLSEEEPFQKPQKYSQIEKLLNEDPENGSKKDDLIQRHPESPSYREKHVPKTPPKKRVLKEEFPSLKKITREAPGSPKNRLERLYQKYTPHELLVVLPAILSRKSFRSR